MWSGPSWILEDSVQAPELALWGTEIGLWDWDVVNDRLTWINDWCEHSQLDGLFRKRS